MLRTYFDEYYYLSDAERKKMNNKYKPETLFVKRYNYNDWYKNVESSGKEELFDKEESVDFSATTRRWWRRSKRRKTIKKFNSKQVINQTSNIISTNKN